MMNRVRRARRSSVLPCGHWALTGQLIVSRSHGPWICLPCAIAAIRSPGSDAPVPAGRPR
jgi:hypothetical protein